MERKVKLPCDCSSIDEVRLEIDRIDKEVVRLLGERLMYVKEVVKYKAQDVDSISAKLRYEKVIEERTSWAKQYQLDPTVVEQIYRVLMDYFIDEQLKIANLKK